MTEPAADVAESKQNGDDLLRSVLQALGHRPEGYRRVRSAPERRLRRRLAELRLEQAGYLRRLEQDPTERAFAERLVTVTVTRFFRDREVWQYLRSRVLPPLAARWKSRFWCAGAAGGEEAYSLAILCLELGIEPSSERKILATDWNEDNLNRAKRAVYGASSLRDVAPDLLAKWFAAFESGAGSDSQADSGADADVELDEHQLHEPVRKLVSVAPHDLATAPWPRQLSLILMRNVVFTYWGEKRQHEACAKLRAALECHGWLVIGSHESLPPGADAWFSQIGKLPIYRSIE